MDAEKLLYYSPNCFGTADAISYHGDGLRIHDLKTGVTHGSVKQPLIYAAIFCLEYDKEPKEIHLRLYQHEEILEYSPPYSEVFEIMMRIVEFDKLLTQLE